jgi:hypothetical protein
VTAAAGALSVLFSWYYSPYLAARNQALGLNGVSPLTNPFALRGVAFAAWTLAAFAIGALAGMLIRRVVPAILATLVIYAGLAVAAGLYLRQHYLTPLVAKNLNAPYSAMIVSQWWTKGGKFAFAGPPSFSLLQQVCPRPPRGSQSSRVPLPPRLHAVDQLSAGQPVLGLPVDRKRLAARAVSAAHRRDHLAGPPPRGVSDPSRSGSVVRPGTRTTAVRSRQRGRSLRRCLLGRRPCGVPIPGSALREPALATRQRGGDGRSRASGDARRMDHPLCGGAVSRANLTSGTCWASSSGAALWGANTEIP